MLEPRHRLGLAQQPRLALAGLVASRWRRLPQQLDRDLAIELRIVGGVHLAGAAGAERDEQHVATGARARRQHVLEQPLGSAGAAARGGRHRVGNQRVARCRVTRRAARSIHRLIISRLARVVDRRGGADRHPRLSAHSIEPATTSAAPP